MTPVTMVTDEYPPFVAGGSRFPQSTFRGRLRHFLDVTDPRLLLTGRDELQQAVTLINQYKRDKTASATNRQLWEAQRIKQAIIHPDTGEKIPMPFRMSGFVVFGIPMVVGILLPNQTLPRIVFWQWLNQTHNACVNYANRNASKPAPMSRFLAGYCGAVSAACGIAFSLTLLIRRSSAFSATTRLIVQKFVPLPAVAVASSANVVLMRNNELSEGIQVRDKDENVVGVSKIAARKALEETTLTRALLPAPIILIPATVMSFLERTRMLRRYPWLHLPCNAVSATLAFAVALPVVIALFPQVSEIDTDRLEEHIRKATTQTVLYYNKGL